MIFDEKGILNIDELVAVLDKVFDASFNGAVRFSNAAACEDETEDCVGEGLESVIVIENHFCLVHVSSLGFEGQSPAVIAQASKCPNLCRPTLRRTLAGSHEAIRTSGSNPHFYCKTKYHLEQVVVCVII